MIARLTRAARCARHDLLVDGGSARQLTALTDSVGQVLLCLLVGQQVTVRVRYRDAQSESPNPLAPLAVVASSRRLEQAGFYERAKRGVGRFIDRA